MTIEEKRSKLIDFCREQPRCCDCALGGNAYKCGVGFAFSIKLGEEGYITDDEIVAAYEIAFPDTEQTTPHIKDSGDRTEFQSGAVRDMQKGKGRCDLMPLDVVAQILDGGIGDSVINAIHGFTKTGNTIYLYEALECFRNQMGVLVETMLLETAKHFEEGAEKYGENNWQKGLPLFCYVNSAIRHYLKWLRDDTDEPHDRAFCWNIMCGIWTCRHKPELNSYRKDGGG